MGSAPFGDAVAGGGLYEYQGYHGGFAGGHGLGQPAGRAPALDDGETEGMDASAAAAVAAMEMAKRNCGGGREEKAAMALKSHSEAERRRRERINAHLATLRTMVPCTDKVSTSPTSLPARSRGGGGGAVNCTKRRRTLTRPTTRWAEMGLFYLGQKLILSWAFSDGQGRAAG